MAISGKTIIRTAGVMGFISVALGAFGAHMLKAELEASGYTAVWATAVDYQFVHSLGLLVLGFYVRSREMELSGIARVFWCWVLGMLFFCGSLYGLALGGPKILGPVTPLGGLLLMAGWVLIVFMGERKTGQ